MTKALSNILQTATPEQLHNGLVWYKQAHAHCKYLASAYDISLDKVCQVMAILSPAVSWEVNKRDCERLLEYGEAATVSTYGQNKAKALRVIAGLDTINEKALKTYSFYKNILNPECTEHVTIDRHAFKAYKGKTKAGSVSVKVTDYRKAKKAYQRKAKELNMLPNQLQAIVWMSFRENVLGHKPMEGSI